MTTEVTESPYQVKRVLLFKSHIAHRQSGNMEVVLFKVLHIVCYELRLFFCRSYMESSQMCTVNFVTLGNETVER